MRRMPLSREFTRRRPHNATQTVQGIPCLLALLATILLAQTASRAQSLFDSRAPYQWFASTDAKRSNHDYLELQPNETRRILLTNGKLLRLWFTSSNPEKCDVSLQNGAQNVVLLKNGKATFGELFNKAWLLYPSQNASSSTRLAQLSANAALVVTNRDKDVMKFFYQAAIGDSSQKSAAIPTGKTTQITSEWTLQPGASRDFVVNGGNGVVRNIEIRYDASDLRGGTTLSDKEVLNGVSLQAAWDGEKTLSVDATLAQLAGGWNDTNVPQSAVTKTGKNEFELLWPMPLPAKRKISLRNSTKAAINFYITTTIQSIPVPQMRFHARFGSELTTPGKPIQVLKVQGSGALVGLNLDMRPIVGSTRRTFVFLEGNEIIKSDNRVLEGTGNEDFFNSAWYFPDKPFARAFGGMTRKTLVPPGVSAYRWLLPDAISFRSNLDFQFGHSGTNTTNNMNYRWVAFWYADAKSRFQIEDNVSATGQQTSNALQQSQEVSSPEDDTAKKIGIAGLILLILGGTAALQYLSSRRKS